MHVPRAPLKMAPQELREQGSSGRLLDVKRVRQLSSGEGCPLSVEGSARIAHWLWNRARLGEVLSNRSRGSCHAAVFSGIVPMGEVNEDILLVLAGANGDLVWGVGRRGIHE